MNILDYSHKNLYSFPFEVLSLANVDCLNLDNNQLTEISERIGELKELLQLSLRDNKLSHLPNSIGDLTLLS